MRAVAGSPDMQAPRDPSAPVDPLPQVATWIFDLDNTLYPASTNLFSQVDRRMGEYIARLLSLDLTAARSLQKQYFRQHGTTLRGLMLEHGIDPLGFLDYVHDIDLSVLQPRPALATALTRLDGRKIVYTNGSADHALRTLERLGIAGHFEAIVDIVDSGYVPKPEPAAYDRMVSRHGIAPRTAAMVEDIAANLEPAYALGMTTVWLRGPYAWSRPAADADYVHHVIDDLDDWLSQVVTARAGGPPARRIDKRGGGIEGAGR